ncbi:MAG: DUF2917 domain-containing protein [Rubrivivax sp.]|nr:DUF2917 domain-containing protein [Rubrivivax sp.]
MNATKTTRTPQFRIGTRTEIRLDDQRLLTLSLRAGDLLRAEGGTVWATVDGERDDIVLEPGDVHAVPRDCELRVSAFGQARLEIYGHGPLHYEGPRRKPVHRMVVAAWRAIVSGKHPAIVSVRALAKPA